MSQATKEWLQERVTITLTRDEMFGLATAVADASRSDVEFTKVRDRNIRKMFRESIEKRHALWRKVTSVAEEYKGDV